jgi:long-subunit fatty acid transport protein
MNQCLSAAPRVFILLLSFLWVLWSHSPDAAFGQPIERIEIPSSPNPVGSGARALGMGSAFIAVADDATAASWNPGGLIQLEKPEISSVGAFFHRIEDNDFGTNPEASGKETVTETNLNFLSAAYPFTLFNRNMIVSLNYQRLFDFTREWDFPLTQSTPGLSLNQDVDYDQSGNLSALALAYCIQVTPEFSFGFTFNIWQDWFSMNEWKQTTRQNGSGTFMGNQFNFESKSQDRFSFRNFNLNANVGILWNITPKFTLGTVIRTPFTADLKHKSTFKSSIQFPTNPGADSSTSTSSKENEELNIPMSYGIGLAYRFSDRLTVSADFTRSEWDDFIFKDSEGNKTSAISGRPKNDSDVDPTYTVRFGAEYLFVEPTYVIPLRGGVFYDPAPAEGSPDDFYGFSLGSGFAKGRFIFDIAYQYRFGRDVGDSILQNLDFSQDVDEHSLFASLIVHL